RTVTARCITCLWAAQPMESSNIVRVRCSLYQVADLSLATKSPEGLCIVSAKETKSGAMKLLSAPRQPFVGLAAMAGLGIILAEFFPLPSSALVGTALIMSLCAVVLLRWPSLITTYAVVGTSFFLLHGLRTNNTEGQQLAAELGNPPRLDTGTR